jgi:predicted phosphodiesterase
VRTLVVSDLHLGARARPGVLTRREPLNRLVEALDGVDRLVLLGDVVESANRRAMQVAEPVLGTVGRAMGRTRTIVLVPGNHDRALIRNWIWARGPRLGTADAVPPDATPALARLTSWLKPAAVEARYPGAWLSERVWATHGHYLDRHLLPESAFGVWRGLLARPAPETLSPRDYERLRVRSLAGVPGTLKARLPRPIGEFAETVSDVLRAATMPLAPGRLLQPWMAPLTSGLLGAQMRRASIPALARAVQRLGVDADWVVFGHVHRLGPLDGDEPDQWQGPDGRPRIANSGSWVYEPLLLHRATPPHPYWPGGAVVVDGERDPVAVGLLDDLPAGALR